MTSLIDRLTKIDPMLPIFRERLEKSSCSHVHFPIFECIKSSGEAIRLRNLGNKSYQAKRDKEALLYYTQSIAAAPTDSEELLLAFGNRSAVLLNLKNYAACILDINRVFKGSCPDRIKSKLLNRKNECKTRMFKENDQKSKMINEMIKRKPALDEFEKIAFRMEKIPNDETDISSPDKPDPIWLTKFNNTLLQNISSKVKLEYSSKWGRYWVATEDIKPGEILSVEEYFSLAAYWEDRIHCAYCMVRYEALIPCPGCSLQMYCSERCRQQAYDSYHRIECKMLPFMSSFLEDGDPEPESPFVALMMLSLRTFLMGTKQGAALTELMNDPNIFNILENKLSCIGVPFPNDYTSVLHLDTKAHDTPATAVNLSKPVFAVQIFEALQRTPFFNDITSSEDEVSDRLSDEKLFAGLLLLHHISSVTYNNFGIYDEFVDNPNSIKAEVKRKKIGFGLCSKQSFINHACNANSAMVSRRRSHVTFSLRPIKANEQIFISYDDDYGYKTLKERQFKLSLYKVPCNCAACAEDWPTIEVLLKTKGKYLIKDEKKITEIGEMLDWLTKSILGSFRYQFIKNPPKNVIKFSKTVRNYVKEPAAVVWLCEKYIVNSIELKGNFYVTYSFLDFFNFLMSKP